MYDLLIKNANIITMDQNLSRHKWVGVKDGKIAALGSDDVEAKAAKVIDLEGKTVLPGMMDCHTHPILTGLSMNSIDLQGAKTIEEVLLLMKAGIADKTHGGWVFGVNFLPQFVQENRYPTKHELDSVCPDIPMMIFAATFHGSAVNSKAEEICKVPDDMPGVEKEDGKPIGVYLSDESSFWATSSALGSLPDDVLWRFIKDCADFAATQGITVMHGFFGMLISEDKDLRLILERQDELSIGMVIFYQDWKVDGAISLGLPRVGGCLCLDGSPFEYTMANYEPYACEPSMRGVLYKNDAEVYDVVSKAHARGMQAALHAVGERAIDQLIYTYDRVIKEQGQKDLRHRIEHFTLPTDEQIKMAAELGVIMSMQPGIPYTWDQAEGGPIEYVLGRERANRMDPYPKILAEGGIICGGSDSPVTKIQPLVDIASCVQSPNPVRNITMDQALRLLTIDAAFAGHLEKTKGSIEVGKDADFTIVDRDPYAYVDSKELYDMELLYTIREGNIIFQK